MSCRTLIACGLIAWAVGAAGVAYGQGHDVPHVEDFEGFDLGPLAPQGGWEAPPERNALVVEDRARSGRQSIKTVDDEGGQRDTDVLMQYANMHEFSGCYQLSIYSFLPGTHIGESYFILMSQYNEEGRTTWAVQMHFNAASGRVCADFGGDCLPAILDQWVEIRVDIDFENDLHQIYDGGQPVFPEPKSWKNAMNGGNPPQVGALNLYANRVCCHYFDDLDFRQVECSAKCQYAIRKSKARQGCQRCPERGEMRESESLCDAIKDCPRKIKDSIDCPQGRGSCSIKAKRANCQ